MRHPRSYLFVPGDREDMLAGADGRGADSIVVDFEDSVTSSRKEKARRLAMEWSRARDNRLPPAWLRVNGDPDLFDADIAGMADGCFAGIFLPKVGSPAAVEHAIRTAPDETLRVIALIESAEGVLKAPEIARHPAVVTLALGEVDLAGDTGIMPGPDQGEWLPIRAQVVLATAAAGRSAPIGPVAVRWDEPEALRESTERLLRIGFESRMVIHPAQIPVVHEVLTPSDDEMKAARRIVSTVAAAEAAGRGASVDPDGSMLDIASVRAARRVLERAPETSDN